MCIPTAVIIGSEAFAEYDDARFVCHSGRVAAPRYVTLTGDVQHTGAQQPRVNRSDIKAMETAGKMMCCQPP